MSMQKYIGGVGFVWGEGDTEESNPSLLKGNIQLYAKLDMS